MKKRTIIRPSGKLITYNEYGPKDYYSDVRKVIDDRNLHGEFDKILPKKNYRDQQRWKESVHGQIIRKAWKKIIDRLMEKDRMVIKNGKHLVIGVRPGETRRHDSWGEERNVSLHIQGGKSKAYFRMSLARRKELRDRIEKGEVFHNAN